MTTTTTACRVARRGRALAARGRRHVRVLAVLCVAGYLLAALGWPSGQTTRGDDLTLAQAHSLLAIHDASVRWHVSEAWLDSVAFCESTMQPSAVGQAGEQGIFQFLPSTYFAVANAIDRAKGPRNAWSAAYEAAKLFAEGESYLWTCARS